MKCTPLYLPIKKRKKIPCLGVCLQRNLKRRLYLLLMFFNVFCKRKTGEYGINSLRFSLKNCRIFLILPCFSSFCAATGHNLIPLQSILGNFRSEIPVCSYLSQICLNCCSTSLLWSTSVSISAMWNPFHGSICWSNLRWAQDVTRQLNASFCYHVT